MVRLVPKKRWDIEKVGNISATPMDFKTRNLDIIEQYPEPHAHTSDGVEAHDDESMPAAKGRRIQISWKHLQDFGFTSGCHRCSLHRQGLHARARHSRHNEACRTRIYNEVRANTRNMQPDEERRLEVKTKPPKEPNHDEAQLEEVHPATPPEPKDATICMEMTLWRKLLTMVNFPMSTTQT